MANIKSSGKRAKQGERRRQHNMTLRSRMRTAIKNVIKAADDGHADQAAALFKTAEPQIDNMANKGIIHKNKAARTKSRLHKRIRNISA
ncbi:MAG: 30S ribosomal protein S20 [Gammaproteobacteria bacterium]